MRVLVTGGAGFIGRNLVPALLARPGVSVRVLDLNRMKEASDSLACVEQWPGDVRDEQTVATAAAGMDAVVHLAALPGVEASIRDPLACFRTNVEGTFRILEAARRQRVSTVLFASSNAAVGAHPPPLHEGLIPRPLSPYGAAKSAGEALCAAYAASFAIRAIALRFSNVYGPYCGEKDSVVAVFLRRALQRLPLVLHGDGRQTRDFLYVADACEAIWLALHHGEAGGIYQIGSGQETSIERLAETVSALVAGETGAALNLERATARAGDIIRNCASIARARDALGYQPRVPLEEGLRETWRWMRTASVEATFPGRQPE